MLHRNILGVLSNMTLYDSSYIHSDEAGKIEIKKIIPDIRIMLIIPVRITERDLL